MSAELNLKKELESLKKDLDDQMAMNAVLMDKQKHAGAALMAASNKIAGLESDLATSQSRLDKMTRREGMEKRRANLAEKHIVALEDRIAALCNYDINLYIEWHQKMKELKEIEKYVSPM